MKSSFCRHGIKVPRWFLRTSDSMLVIMIPPCPVICYRVSLHLRTPSSEPFPAALLPLCWCPKAGCSPGRKGHFILKRYLSPNSRFIWQNDVEVMRGDLVSFQVGVERCNEPRKVAKQPFPNSF